MISVIVPVYNAEKYLDECLESIAEQTYKDFEVILVDDGSTDLSKSICQKYCAKYSNFKLINKDNGGQMSAWILALSYVKGEFVSFVDSDDLIEKKFLEKLIDCQKLHDADLVMCSRQVFLDGNNEHPIIQNLELDGFYSEKDIDHIRSLFLPTFYGNLSQARWDKLFKTDIYKKCARKYCKNPVRTFEDRFIVVPYVFYSKSFEFINEPLYKCRIVQNSSSKKFRPELCQISDQLFEERIKLLNDLNLYDKYINRIELEKIDLLRAIFERNVSIKSTFKVKYQESKKILKKNNRKLVVKNKKECIGKFGKFLYICCKINSPFLMAIAGKINSNRRNG